MGRSKRNELRVINFMYDKNDENVAFHCNGWWMFRYSYPGCTLWEYNIEILNVKRTNVVKAMYMVRCLSKVKDSIYMSYKQLCEEYKALDPSIKESVIKHDVLLLSHDAYLEYRGNVPYDDDDFETTDYYFIPYTDDDDSKALTNETDCYGDVDSYGDDEEDDDDLDLNDYYGIEDDYDYDYDYEDDDEDDDDDYEDDDDDGIKLTDAQIKELVLMQRFYDSI